MLIKLTAGFDLRGFDIYTQVHAWRFQAEIRPIAHFFRHIYHQRGILLSTHRKDDIIDARHRRSEIFALKLYRAELAFLMFRANLIFGSYAYIMRNNINRKKEIE